MRSTTVSRAEAILSRLDASSISYHIFCQLLRIAPTKQAKRFIATSVVDAYEKGDECLDALRETLFSDILQQSFHDQWEPKSHLSDSWGDQPLNRVRGEITRRENFRGIVDRHLDEWSKSVAQLGPGETMEVCHATHILSAPITNLQVGEEQEKRIEEFRRRFAGIIIGDNEWESPKFRTARNYILLEDTYFRDFTHLQMWFEAVKGKRATYTVAFSPTEQARNKETSGRVIKFHDPAETPLLRRWRNLTWRLRLSRNVHRTLPDHRYLALHAMLAQLLLDPVVFDWLRDLTACECYHRH